MTGPNREFVYYSRTRETEVQFSASFSFGENWNPKTPRENWFSENSEDTVELTNQGLWFQTGLKMVTMWHLNNVQNLLKNNEEIQTRRERLKSALYLRLKKLSFLNMPRMYS